LKAEKDQEERMKMYNPWTGNIHYPDGHDEFVEGGRVGGANKWLGTHKPHKFSTDEDEIKPHKSAKKRANRHHKTRKHHGLN
jgi:hypothetical protein